MSSGNITGTNVTGTNVTGTTVTGTTVTGTTVTGTTVTGTNVNANNLTCKSNTTTNPSQDWQIKQDANTSLLIVPSTTSGQVYIQNSSLTVDNDIKCNTLNITNFNTSNVTCDSLTYSNPSNKYITVNLNNIYYSEVNGDLNHVFKQNTIMASVPYTGIYMITVLFTNIGGTNYTGFFAFSEQTIDPNIQNFNDPTLYKYPFSGNFNNFISSSYDHNSPNFNTNITPSSQISVNYIASDPTGFFPNNISFGGTYTLFYNLTAGDPLYFDSYANINNGSTESSYYINVNYMHS